MKKSKHKKASLPPTSSWGRYYDHLFFDLDNTLWDFDTNSKLALMETVSQLDLVSKIDDFDSFFEFYESVNAKLWGAYRLKTIRKSELTRKRFADTLEHFNIEGVDPLEMNELYLKLMPLQTKLFPDVVETLDYLETKGYQMHIITNGFAEVQHRKIESSGLQPHFRRIFISEEIQAPKPDRRIFEHALTSCNAKKNRSLMIGDSWESDIVGARDYGISQVLISKNTKNDAQAPENQGDQIQNTHLSSTTPQCSTFIIESISYLTKLL